MKTGSTENCTTCRQGCKTVLVLAPNWLGDAVMALPLIEGIRRCIREADVYVGCSRYVAPLFMACRGIDGLAIWDTGSGVRRRIGALNKIRPEGGWDVCFVLPTSFSSALTAAFSRSSRRLGYSTEKRGMLLTDRLPGSFLRTEHLSRSYIRILETFCGVECGDTPLPRLTPSEGWREKIREKGIEGDYFVIAPGAVFGSAKVWPAERFTELTGAVSRKTGWKAVVSGSAAETDGAAEMLARSGAEGVNIAGGCSIEELIDILCGARAVVGNDSGPVHIAAALGSPVVSIFGSTDPVWTSPRGEKVRILYSGLECSPCFKRECPDGSIRCLRSVTVEDVLENVLDISAV